MLVVRSAAVMALLAVVAAQNPVLAQDADAKKKAELQSKCAAAKEQNSPLHRLRVDGFTVEGKKVNIAGVLLHGGLNVTPEEKDKGIDTITAEKRALNTALTLIVEEIFGAGSQAATDKLTFVVPKDLPHVKLQAEANAQKHDEVLIDPVTFDKDGKAVLKALVGSDAEKEWLAKEWKSASEKKLSADTEKVLGAGPIEIKVEKPWKLSKAAIQKALADSKQNLNRMKIERVWFEWVANGDLLARRVAIGGISLDSKDYPIVPAEFNTIVTGLWPELSNWIPDPRVIGPDFRIPESGLVAALRTAIADLEPLDGVRVDAGMAFDAEGKLLLAGIIPKQEAPFAIALEAAVKKIAKDRGPVKDKKAELFFSQATEGGVSTAKMQLIQTAKLLGEVREWAALEVDDVLLRRLYFNADGKLTLLGRFAEPGTDKQVLKKYQSVAETYLSKSDPVVDLKPFGAGFTAHLRGLVETDQKSWAGVLLERGYFSPEGAYGIRGLADRDDQPAILGKIIKEESKNPRWAGYFDAAPNVVDMKVMPLAPMLARLQRVCPGYPAFDHLELTGVVQHPKDGLVLSVSAYTRSSTELAALTADWLLKRHPDWKRRAKPGVKFKTSVEADTSDESRWLSPFLTAEALAKKKLPQARLGLASATRHFPDSSGTWYLSALYHGSIAGDQELVRRDLYRVIQLEGQLLPSRDAYRNDARSSRFDLAEKVHGPERASVEALEPWLRREMRDGRQQIQLVAEPDVVLPK